MTRKKDLPPPDMSRTDSDEILRSRVNLNIPVGKSAAHTQVEKGEGQVRTGKGTRPDPAGMRRTSFYISAAAAAAVEDAADRILQLLGDDTPRHVALSALLTAGADQVETVVQKLAKQRTAELTARLAALKEQAE
ncbi:hypothetical protein ACFVMC_32960 [Nocardia sp. NPDC127579]|uniref:hypothetical protein n=1 Tax=Nocardia sp. NPDC127579 TaxID=3345402 RepID=UPI00362FF585